MSDDTRRRTGGNIEHATCLRRGLGAWVRRGRAVALFTLLASTAAEAQLQFEEATAAAGIAYSGPSYGASWGDFDADGRPDIWISHHANPGQLLRNNGDGTFTDATGNASTGSEDTHGAAWGDFNNDGFQDLLQLVGGGGGTGSGANLLFVNSATGFSEEASARGLTYGFGRGRTPLWFDYDLDGELDVFVANVRRGDGLDPSALFAQNNGSFEVVNDAVGLQTTGDNSFAQIARLTDEEYPALLVHGGWPYPDRILRYDQVPFADVTPALGMPSFPNTRDIALADFNGDLRTDIYVVRGRDDSAVVKTGDREIDASLVVKTPTTHGFSFAAGGEVQIRVLPEWNFSPQDIHIGSAGSNPASNDFSLSPTDPGVYGMMPFTSGVDRGLYVGYDPVAQRWSVSLSTPVFLSLNLVIEGEFDVSEPVAAGFTSSDGQLPDKLLLQGVNGFTDVSKTSGLGGPDACESAVAADFDNDMDVDIFIVCRGAVRNNPNILLENLGQGVFARVPLAGGAEGSSSGRGGSVAAADYDGDGFMDLFVTNGQGAAPFNSGPDQLYRNVGNSNNWIEIDLEGVLSNRDGVGVTVLATAGGMTQLREHHGGIHQYAQNHGRIHFGLGPNTAVDELVLQWPSGIVQVLHDIPAGSLIRVIESHKGTLYGKPDYQPGQDAGVFVWKESYDGPYHLRISGAGSGSNYVLRVMADRPIDSLLQVQVSQNDIVQWNENQFGIAGWVKSWQDGVDFEIAPEARVLISFARANVEPYARQVHVGGAGEPPPPGGWILDLDALPPPPAFQGGVDLGLFIGRDPASGNVVARLNGDTQAGGQSHDSALRLLFDDPTFDVTPVGMELNDTLTTLSHGVIATGRVGSWWDGIDVEPGSSSFIAIGYEQDGLFQPHRVNYATSPFHRPNAYALPIVSAFGTPGYDPGSKAGLFLWRGDDGTWHLRGTAGGGFRSYRGLISSTLPAISVAGVGLEPNDLLDTSNPSEIRFDLHMSGPWQDGIDLRFPDSAEVRLISDPNEPIAPAVVWIGADQWPVAALPVVLSRP